MVMGMGVWVVRFGGGVWVVYLLSVGGWVVVGVYFFWLLDVFVIVVFWVFGVNLFLFLLLLSLRRVSVVL